MKKYITLILLLLICCKKEDNVPSSTNSGSNTGVKQYTLEVSISHSQYLTPAPCVSHVVGLGYTSTDIGNDAFFDRGEGSTSGTIYKFTLNEGLYYYKGTACCGCNSQLCGGIGMTNCKSSSGSINLNKSSTVQININ